MGSAKTYLAIYVLKETAGKGNGVFAARDIKQGEHLYREACIAINTIS
jgi:hypothetical protein